jgi:hypothetical protein
MFDTDIGDPRAERNCLPVHLPLTGCWDKGVSVLLHILSEGCNVFVPFTHTLDTTVSCCRCGVTPEVPRPDFAGGAAAWFYSTVGEELELNV